MAIMNLNREYMAEFTPLECSFKYIYEKKWSPEEALVRMQKDPYLTQTLKPVPDEETTFRQILTLTGSDGVLIDEIFFRDREDVFMNIHPRYMPAFKHKHRFFELQYVLAGTLKQVVAGHELTLHAGDVCFIAPETEHVLSVYDDSTVIVNILIKVETFRSVFISQLNKDDIISDFFSRVLMCTTFYPYIYCRTEIGKDLSSVIYAMVDVDRSNMRLKNRMLVTKLEEFFIYLLDAHENDFVTGSSIGETDKKMLPILRYIQDHFKTVTLSEMASFFNYSEPYLSRIITVYSGSSFSQIVKEIRLKNAARMLENTDIPIADISEESGYDDRTYFHRAFKKQYGMTPVEYRRMNAPDKTASPSL